MKRFVILLILLSMGSVAVAYAAETSTSSREFIFGDSVQSANSLNQVLVLLTGKDGAPGAVGVAGPQGLRGVDGLQGVPGIEGAPGVAGRDGLPGADGLQGPQGIQGAQGIQGIQGATGSQGPQGVAGPAGPAGPAGGGTGGGTISYGVGEVSVGACSTSATVGVKARFISYGESPVKSDFVFDSITINDLNANCRNKTLKFYFNVKSSPAILRDPFNLYNNGEYIECAYPLTAWNGTSQISLGATTSCSNLTSSASVLLREISTADFTDAIGFEIS
jgi:hypothetical protein